MQFSKIYIFIIFLLVTLIKITLIVQTINSVTGNVAQTPFILAIKDKKNAIGIIMIKPRNSDITCAGNGCSIEVK